MALLGFEFEAVEFVHDDGPAIEWETPTGLTLKVPPRFGNDPVPELTDDQRFLIGPDDDVAVLCLPRVKLPGAPPRLIPRQAGNPRTTLPRNET